MIPTDENFQMNTQILKETLIQLEKERVLVICVVAVCGTTETGSIDPIYDIAKIAQSHGIHLHVDAAWGGPLIYSSEHSHKLYGIHLADSLTVDGHKQLFTPLGLGILLFKNPDNILSIRKTAQYVIRKDSPDLGKFTLEGSRPANIVYLHACLTLLGKEGLGVLLTRSCALVKQMSVRLSEHPSKSFEILHEPQSNILLYRYIPANLRKKDRSEWISPETTLILNRYVERIQNQVAAIQDSRPHAFTSRTTVLYHDLLTSCFRIVISNPLTQWQNIVDGIANQLVVAQSVEREFEVEEMMRRVMTAYPGMESGDALQGWSGWPFDI